MGFTSVPEIFYCIDFKSEIKLIDMKYLAQHFKNTDAQYTEIWIELVNFADDRCQYAIFDNNVCISIHSPFKLVLGVKLIIRQIRQWIRIKPARQANILIVLLYVA